MRQADPSLFNLNKISMDKMNFGRSAINYLFQVILFHVNVQLVQVFTGKFVSEESNITSVIVCHFCYEILFFYTCSRQISDFINPEICREQLYRLSIDYFLNPKSMRCRV